MPHDRGVYLVRPARPAQYTGLGQAVPAVGHGDGLRARCPHVGDKPRIADLLGIAQQAQPHLVQHRANALRRRRGQIGIGLHVALVIAHPEQAAAVGRPRHRERRRLQPALAIGNAAQREIGQHAVAVGRLAILGECNGRCRSGREQPQVVVAYHHGPLSIRCGQRLRVGSGQRDCCTPVGRQRALQALRGAAAQHHLQRADIGRSGDAGHLLQHLVGVGSTSGLQRHTQPRAIEQRLARGHAGVHQQVIGAALRSLVAVPEPAIVQPVRQHRGIAYFSAQVSIQYPFGARVVLGGGRGHRRRQAHAKQPQHPGQHLQVARCRSFCHRCSSCSAPIAARAAGPGRWALSMPRTGQPGKRIQTWTRCPCLRAYLPPSSTTGTKPP